MRLKLILAVALSLTLAACNRGGDTAETLTPPAFGGAPDLPAVATTPSPLPAPLGDVSAAVNPGLGGVGNFVAGSQESLRAEAGDRIFFQTNSSDLDGRAQDILRGVATWLQTNGGRSLTIEGHADERGTREFNIALGDRRANAVRNFLVASGVPASKVQTISFGKERPAASGSAPRSWALNRRAVFIVR